MNQRLINLFTITTIIPFLLIRKAISIDPHFLACNPKTCGDGQNITFPFYIEGVQKNYCGYPGFNVSCRNNGTVLRLQGSDYIIHQISYENQIIRVSNTAAFNACGVSPSRNSSLLPNENFKLYSNQTQLVLMYHCNSSEIGGGANSELMKYKVNCSGDSNSTLSLFKDDPLLGRASGVCENAIVTDVDVDSKGDTRSTEIERMLERGFLLNWIASNCSICQSSGGKCGFDFEMVHFKCFCPDRPHAWRCANGVICIEDKMRKNRLKWFDHIKRRASDAPVRRLERWQEEERVRGRGRPKQTWKRVIESDMRLLGIEKTLVVNRMEWRERISVADAT